MLDDDLKEQLESLKMMAEYDKDVPIEEQTPNPIDQL